MSALDQNLLSNFRVMRANDPDIAEQRVKSGFGATRVNIRKSSNEFVLRANHLQLTNLGLTYVATTGEVSASFPESRSIRQIFNITGTGGLTTGPLSEAIISGLWSSVLPAGEKCTISFGPNYAHLVLKIKRDALHDYLRALLNDEIDREIEFLPPTIDDPAMRSLRSGFSVFHELQRQRPLFFFTRQRRVRAHGGHDIPAFPPSYIQQPTVTQADTDVDCRCQNCGGIHGVELEQED